MPTGLMDDAEARPLTNPTITPKMIAAGANVLYGFNRDFESEEDAAERVFEAMIGASREDFSEASPLAKAEHKLLVQLAFIVNKLLLKGRNHEAYTPEIVQAFGLDFVQTMRECGLEP